jgi:signal transduction histidine kinase/CheY-like chemotaxis protein
MTGARGHTLDAWLERVHPEDAPRLRAALDAHVRGETPSFEAEYRQKDAGGAWRWLIARGLADRAPGGVAVRMACWQTDVTDQREDAAAAARGAYLDHVADATGLAVFALDEADRVIRHNEAAVVLAGPWGAPEALWSEVVAAAPQPTLTPCGRCGADEAGGSAVVALPLVDDTRHLQVTWTGHLHRLLRGQRVSVVAIADVTERVRAEQAAAQAHAYVAASAAELRAVLDAVPEAVVAAAGDRVLYCNAGAHVAFGRAGEGWLGTLRRGAGAGQVTLPTAEGKEAVFEVSAPVPVTFFGERAELLVARDVSQRLRMESQLRGAERMVALGGLAAGLAHEINNPLTYVIGNLELAQDGTGDVAGRISRALGGAVRVRQVVAQLRAMVSPVKVELGTVDLPAAVEGALGLAAGVGLPVAHVEREIGPGVTVHANGVWVGQILLNLITNALLAMGERPPAARHLRLRSEPRGGQVRIEVTDSGPGVAEEVRDRLFEPFVSTRLKGEGSGLGLYICRELAGRMGGRLELGATGPAGTTFALWLPAGGPVAPEPEPPPPAPTPRVPGRVLVVDDEPVITEVIQGFLRHHDVTVEATAAGARAAFATEDWDVIVLDIVLGRDSGIELWRALEAAGSPLAERVVFVTGGSMTPDIARFLMETDLVTLVKPFDFRELQATVDTAVARRRVADA